ncbi:acyltransferase domain-containing protein [Streptomyces sp. NRRL B-1677]|uniref:type I polyketide synthase n=1 Tax=Streptomyces sp. NRRL B-1677 TaxID=2682966 RepID=UPI001892BB1D|nr:type I polyketide synthase [Streptomyces sp. NRRL B-1677]MBF6047944.1 acyltransferase domain-containing protein [Streptomyces sp. NRRL B-1677]
MTHTPAPPVAVIGMAVLLPGSPGLETYWRNLTAGTDAITDVPAERWDARYYDPAGARGADRIYCRRGGFVDEFAVVDAARCGIMPAAVPGTEPDQLLALHVAAAAVADAGGEQRLPDRNRVGVVLGRGNYMGAGLARLTQRVGFAHQLVHTLRELLPDLEPGQLERVRAAFTRRLGADSPDAAAGLVPNLVASRTASRLDLRGPAYTIDAACASSLVAVDRAVAELATGRCDVMLAGGVHHCHDITLWSVFSQLRALSPSQRIRPFHRHADGLLIGEGSAVVVLKRLADAQRDGDRVYAVVRGTGVSGDGRASGLLSPDPGGQVRAVRQAWRAAGLDPRAPHCLGLLEAHGTATPAGDTAELTTLAEVFGPEAGGDRAMLGSVKSMIGHTMPAAGAAGLVKAALAVHHGVLPPTLHCDDPHPALAGTRFRVTGAAEPWESGSGPAVRRAAVNAFGFGGINAHVVLEQPPPATGARNQRNQRNQQNQRNLRPAIGVSEPERVLALAADTPRELADLLALGSHATAASRGTGRVRLGIVAPTPERRALAARVLTGEHPWRGRNDIWYAPAPLLGPGTTGRIAFVFPGLEAEFAPRADGIAGHFGLPSTAARPSGAGAPVGDLGRHAVEVFALGRLLDGALRRMGIVPDAIAGHSVGEWNAMAMAGMYAREAVDGLLAAFDPDRLRVPGLAFAVLGTSARRTQAALVELGDGRVVLSHDNAPGQCMICGPRPQVEEVVRSLRAEGVFGRILPFQSGFHTPMLAPWLEPITAEAERLELVPPGVPLWSATTASPYPTDPAEVRKLFVRHLLEPVRFRSLVEALHDAGFRAFVQVGTGQLTSLVSATLEGRDHVAVAADSPRRDGLAQLRRVALAVWTHGAGIDPALPPAAGAAATVHRRADPAGVTVQAPTRLALGSTLVSLSGQDLAELRRDLALTRTAATGSGAPGADPVGRCVTALEEAAGRFPPAAELAALIRETAATAAALIDATAPVDAAIPGRGWQTVLPVSVKAMPYLLDHCFIHQRPGWPDLDDRRPVVPGTTIVHHLMDAAERAVPGMRAVAVHHVRFDQWVAADEPVDVRITGTPSPDGADSFDVSFGRSARATVELAPQYPEAGRGAQPPDPAAERTPEHTAARIYDERWMFHGPSFQGITDITAIGEQHVRGVISASATPGALLDNVGQLIGYWIMASRAERVAVLPVGIRHIRFAGPHPAPGTPVECLVRIVSLTDTLLEADAQLVTGGRVWAELTGWQDRRFDNLPETRRVERFPERHTLSRPQPGGWSLLHKWWRDSASRDLVMRNHLGRAERHAYEQQPPRGRGQWLLGRIAVKDAVRQLLWEQGEGPVFPAEIRVGNDERGRPYVTGVHGRTLPELDVSLAHCAETAVALVRHRGSCGPGCVGIDVEEITERPVDLHEFALGPAERRLLASACAESGEPEALWFTRFWAAKEAVAKAEGTGLRGRPRDFTVLSVAPDGLVAAAGRHTWSVRCRRIGNPSGLTARDYVVAWTTGTTDEVPGQATKEVTGEVTRNAVDEAVRNGIQERGTAWTMNGRS